MLGHYDGFVVYEMPDEIAAAAYGLAVSSSGRIDAHETHQLIDTAGALQALAIAPGIVQRYRPPGAPADWREGYDALRS
jgi:hypothetical protein